ncbi:peptidylprolyl isomerase [Paenibacillus pini]
MIRTGQEKVLWAAVIILAAGVLIMGSFILIRGLKPAQSDANPSAEVGIAPVAVFNGTFITDKEWAKELKKAHGQEILLQMLNHKAVLAEAQALQIVVSPQEITQELDRLMKGYDSEQAYYDEMKNQLGLTPNEVKAEIAYQLTLEKIATSHIEITDEEISEYVKEHQEQWIPRTKYQLGFIKVSSFREGNHVLDRLEQGEDFNILAQELSKDEYSRGQGGQLGLVDEEDPFIPQELLKTAKTLEIGDIAGPVKLENGGYGIIQLTNIVSGQPETEQEIHEDARKLLALNEAIPLSQLEVQLREKYHSEIMIAIPTS